MLFLKIMTYCFITIIFIKSVIIFLCWLSVFVSIETKSKIDLIKEYKLNRKKTLI